MADTRLVRTGTSLEPVSADDPKAEDNPTMLVPYQARPALARLYAANAHLLAGMKLPLYFRVREYLDDGLPLDAVAAVVRQLLAPERQCNHRFASDLFADLAALVADALHRVRVARERSERLGREKAAGEPADAGRVRDLLAGIGHGDATDDNAA